jgi:biopolymer transport protein ExbD
MLVSVQAMAAETPKRTMDLEVLANGQLLLRGELIDGVDDLEAKLRVMRDREPPFELSIKLPKTFSFASIASVMKMIQDMGLSLGLTGETRKSAPDEPESSTI